MTAPRLECQWRDTGPGECWGEVDYRELYLEDEAGNPDWESYLACEGHAPLVEGGEYRPPPDDSRP